MNKNLENRIARLEKLLSRKSVKNEYWADSDFDFDAAMNSYKRAKLALKAVKDSLKELEKALNDFANYTQDDLKPSLKNAEDAIFSLSTDMAYAAPNPISMQPGGGPRFNMM